MKSTTAIIERIYGPFAGRERVNGVTFDGQRVWFASGTALVAFDPDTGEETRSLAISAQAGSAFDGRHLYQLGDGKIQKLDPSTGAVLAVIPAPEGQTSGLTWAEGYLWIGLYREKRILKLDAETGRVLQSITSERFVTGVTFSDGALWHGVAGDEPSELRRIDESNGEVLERLALPEDFSLSGLESDGGERFYCGGASSGKVLAVKRPRRAKSA
jgi:glutamine cyclotransferase